MRRISLVVILVGCSANDPIYVQCPTVASTQPECIANLEAGTDDGTGTGGMTANAKSRLLLPITLEKADDTAARMALATQLGVEVPYVKLGDIEVSVEWTVKNLEDMDGEAKVQLNGATEFFEYDPDMIVLSADEEAPPTPPLTGNTPIHIPAGGTVSGTIREDEVKEASIDIEQVTRANVNPFKATLTINKNDTEIVPYTMYDPTMPDVPPMPDPSVPKIPRAAIANMVRVDLVFVPTHTDGSPQHMVLEYVVRVRDIRGKMLADKLMDAPAADLQTFDIMPFAVMAMP